MKIQITLFAILLTIFFSENLFAQGVGINNASPAASALLDLTSTSKGLLIPRMTSAQRIAILAPAQGLLVYETTTDQFFYFDSPVWKPLASNATAWNLAGNAGTIASTNFIGTTDFNDFVMRTNSTEKMRVTAGGNIGIGNSVPLSLLHVTKSGVAGVSPNTGAIITAESNTNGYINILSPLANENGILFGLGGVSASDGAIIYNSFGNRKGFQFRTDGGATKVTIDSTGRIGAGLTPFAKMDVFINTSVDTLVYRGRNNNSLGTITQIGSVEKFQDYSSTIDFNGGSGFAINLNNNATFDLQLGTNSAAKPGTNTWTIGSDARLKDHVQTFKDGLETIKQINPVYYRYNGKGGMPADEYYVGVIAQELQKATPYMVGSYEYTPNPRNMDNREQYLCVDNGALTYVLVNSVKELDEKTEKISKSLKSITDFGTAEIISGNEMTVNFSDDFTSSMQNGKLPVVTVTAVNSNVQVSVNNITSTGFKILTYGNVQNLSINWIAAAKIATEQLQVSKSYTTDEREQLLDRVKVKNNTIRTSAEDAEMKKRGLEN